MRIAVDMVDEGRIDAATALSRVSAEQVATLLLPRLVAGATDGAEVLARGEGACPGVATGVLVADADEAERRAAAGEAVVLVRATTSPDDVHGMIAARAVVTEQGGSTSHAAVVSRALGRPCVVGVGSGAVARAGASVTVDGAGGLVYAGALATEVPHEDDHPQLARLIEWARERSPVRVVRSGDGGLDIDRVIADGSSDDLAAALAGQTIARGSGLANPEIARIAKAQRRDDDDHRPGPAGPAGGSGDMTMSDPVTEMRALLMQFEKSGLKDMYVRSKDWTVFMAQPRWRGQSDAGGAGCGRPGQSVCDKRAASWPVRASLCGGGCSFCRAGHRHDRRARAQDGS